MPNSIDAYLEFSFRGEIHTLSATLDLDRIATQAEGAPSLHHLLAKEHGLDTDSYLFEVMQQEEICFSHPQGGAVEYFHEGRFDLAGYLAQQAGRIPFEALQTIAQQELGIDKLEAHPEIKRALLRAYRLGERS